MGALLLDASAILAAFDVEDEMHPAANAVLADPSATLMTLDLARYEVANVAVRAWRASEQVTTLLEAIDRIGNDGGVIACTTTLLTRAADLAEQHMISVYDAAYAAAASQAGAALVSCDIRDLVDKGLARSPIDVRYEGEPPSSAGGEQA
ncbi:MAG: type II toxin-antitoxin system VapC family toxin [Solirubrobacteraceae bacterium]